MKASYLFLWMMLSVSAVGAQQADAPAEASRPVDSLYREDQFYLGITYNILQDRPPGVTQSSFSYGLLLGFIRDMPINRARTVAVGIGLGYAVNSYYSNLRAIQGGDDIQYIIPGPDASYKRNKLETHLLELPIELRWRNSNATDFSFWRIYAGMKLGYIVGSRSKYVADAFKDTFYNTDTRNFQYGLTLSVGYNALNLHVYYGLNDLFEDGVIGPDGEALGMSPLRLGLIFYFL